MLECAECMYENADDAPACEQCGAELEAAALSMQLGQVCRECDSYNDPGVRVCVSCGTPFAGDGQDSTRSDFEPEAEPEEPIAAAPAARAEATPSPLPPGALPPGWAAFQRQAPSAVSRPAPTRSVSCPQCKAESPATARFCGACGFSVGSGETARGKLILIRGLSGEGRQFPLGTTPTVAGREGTAAFPDDPYVAATHATFFFRDSNLLVRDEGAPNGLYVKLRDAHALKAGDRFFVGERLLRYRGAEKVVEQNAGRHGSPRPSDRLFTVDELLEGGGVGRVCRRPGPLMSIGRAACDLNFSRDGFVSARHAEISMAGDTAFLRDLGSANGTFLRLPSREEHPLQHGDYLLMGRELLRVEIAAAR